MSLHGTDEEYAGWVYKQGSLVKNWKKRYMVLRGRQLTYYDTAKVDPTVKAKGSFQVITVELSPDIQNGLLVHGRGGRVLKLYTASPEATSAWYNMILDATTVAPQQFAPSDRLSTFSASSINKQRSLILDDELELLDQSQPLGEDSEQVIHFGWLKKEGARVKSWKRRYFVLRGNALSYFNSEDTGAAAKGYGHVRAVEVNETISYGLDISFDNGRILRVSARDSTDMQLWLCKLSDAIEAATHERNNVRESLARRKSFRILSNRTSPMKKQLQDKYANIRHTGTPMRHSLACVPSNPRGIVADKPKRRTMYDKTPSSLREESNISSDLSSQLSSGSYHDGVEADARRTSSTSTFFESDDEYDSEESEGDWI